MEKTFKISNGDVTVIPEQKLKFIKSRFGDLYKYNLTEKEQIAYLNFVCDLSDIDFKTYIEYPYFISGYEILISELNKMIKSLPLFHFEVINSYYGFTKEPKTIEEIAKDFNKPIDIIFYHKNEIMSEFKATKNYFASHKIASLKQEIKELQRIKKG